MRWIKNIPQDWLVSEFQKIAELKHGYQFRNYDFTAEGIKIFKITQIEGEGKINISNCSTIDKNRLDQFERVVLKRGDILMALTGATIGKIAKFNTDELVLQNYRVGNFLPLNSDVLDKEYFFQFLRTDYFYNQIISNQTQSAQQNIGKEDINKMLVIFPPLPEQRAIASILSALDDKIELNLQMNKTLEEMAMALYKHWFVDFGPFKDGEFVTSELGDLPKGWEVKSLGEEFKITIGRTPPRNEHEWFSSLEGIKWVSIRDMGIAGAYIFNTSEYLTENAVESKSVPKIPANTVILSFKLTVGRVSITTEEMVSNEAIAHFIHKRGTTLKSEYLYLALKSFDYNSLASTSSIATAVNSQTVKGMRVIVPESSVMEKFDHEVSPLFKMIKINSEEIQTLTTLRDTLLPKLISGEVRVKDAARSLAEVL